MKYFDPPELLKKTPPSHRAAYSNRMAWLLAEMSKLAYLKFEGIDYDKWAKKLKELNGADEIKTFIEKDMIPALPYTAGRGDLNKELEKVDFELVQTFSHEGTQAFLAKRKQNPIAVLAFRGTEATQLADIKADLNVFVTDKDGALIHSGFLKAYENVRNPIQEEIDKLKDCALFVTGHSLGGALALIAVRELNTQNMAACYTFGSPRVGSSEFADTIKPPIYRVVNTADIVPRLPPGLFIEILVDVLRFLKSIVPFLEYVAAWLDNKISGYRHHGDMRYLTHCAKEDYSDLRIISNITWLARWRRLIKNRVSFNRHIKDHGIDEYCKKLAAYLKKKLGLAS